MALRITVSSSDESDSAEKSFRYDFDADRTQLLLGRQGGVDVLLPSERVALVHARIERRGEAYCLVDAGTPGGTRVNGRLIAALERVPLRDHDRIAIGPFSLGVEILRALSADSSFNETSAAVARRMVRSVFDRIGTRDRQPSLKVCEGVDEGEELHLVERERTYLLGFSGDRLSVDAVDAWREHVALVRDESGVTVRLVGAPGIVRVGQDVVSGERLLHDGDELILGGRRVAFADPAEQYLRRLSEAPEARVPLDDSHRRGVDTDTAAHPRSPNPRRGAGLLPWVLIGAGVVVAALSVVAMLWLLGLY